MFRSDEIRNGLGGYGQERLVTQWRDKAVEDWCGDARLGSARTDEAVTVRRVPGWHCVALVWQSGLGGARKDGDWKGKAVTA